MTKNWTLIGIPDDIGVGNVGGRQGARRGPPTFRQYLQRLKERDGVLAGLHDAGNVPLVDDIHQNHREASNLIAKQEGLTVVVGGGHDHVYSHLRAIREQLPQKARLGCINVDPHFDMRAAQPQFTSGSPFRVALEEGLLQGEHLVEFGIQPFANAPELWDFAEEHQVQVVEFEMLRNNETLPQFRQVLLKLAAAVDAIVLSLDLDSIQAAFAPGVSAPAPEGFTPSEVLQMLEMAGNEPKVSSLGIYELNPEFDQDNRTARLAAVAAYTFVAAKLRKR